MPTFWERFRETIIRLVTSGKVLTLIVGLIVTQAAKRGWVLDPSMVNEIVVLFTGLLLAQGANDFGKGKAIIEAQSPKPPETVAIGSVENLKLPPSDPRPAPQGSGIQVKPKDSI